MAAFSTNTTNIFSHPQQRRFHCRIVSTPSKAVKTNQIIRQFPAISSNYSNFTMVPPRVSAAATTVVQEEDSTSTSATSHSNKGWKDFADKISGEWDGFGADFTLEGKPLELPEQVVPEAYREWEVKVFDWQTQCPTLAQLDDKSFMYKNIKLLPTVGCEADAATRHSIDERTLENSSAFAYQNSSGCFVAMWPVKSEIIELEHCLINPRDKESRVRIIQVIGFQGSQMKLKGIKVFVEQWYGPFRNGDQLGGCSIRDSAFASTQQLKASEIVGAWQGVTSVAIFNNSQKMVQQLEGECVHKSIRDHESDLILLPKQMWCSLKTTQNEETYCEVGWLLDQGRAITSKCIFSSSNELQEIALANETSNLA